MNEIVTLFIKAASEELLYKLTSGKQWTGVPVRVVHAAINITKEDDHDSYVDQGEHRGSQASS
jgi:hypothetical protein